MLRCRLLGLALVVALLSLLATERTASAAPPDCVSFVGDVSLSRRMAQVAEKPDLWASIWTGLQPDRGAASAAAAGDGASAFVGNLEGALQVDATVACHNPLGICLPILPRHLQRLADAQFLALSLENNHSLDYDVASRMVLQQRLGQLGIAPLTDEETAPFTLLTRGGTVFALVAVNLINRSADDVDATLLRLRLRLGLARAHTPWVVVLPHWGREYDALAGPIEGKLADLFAAWGARLVVGAHPHVPGDARCQSDFAMYYSLGNLLFDQPMPATHTGLLLRCCRQNSPALDCRMYRTRRRAATATEPLAALVPELAGEVPEQSCRVGLTSPGKPAAGPVRVADSADTAWQRHRGRAALRFVQPFRSLGPQHYFALRRLYSTFDGEHALRPYVFAVRGEQTVDVWRGTALSWPLLYARLFAAPDGRELLCARHRGDSFVHRNPQISRDRRFHAVYAWTGFGFRQVEDAAALAECQKL